MSYPLEPNNYGPYQDYDPGYITNAWTPDPPVEGVDYVEDTVMTPGGPKTMMIRRPRP